MDEYSLISPRVTPRDTHTQNLAVEDRWPFNIGSVTLYFGSRDPGKMANKA